MPTCPTGEVDITRITGIGANPYDALITSDGRTYITGLFGEDGLTALDLWDETPEPIRVLPGYGRGQEDLPVYKMPHLEGWAEAAGEFVLPAVGHHEVLWVDADGFHETGRTKTHGQPVFAMARPDGRQVWVNFAHPMNDTIQIVDTLTKTVIHEIKPGPAVLHMEFTPRGHEVWVSVRDAGKVVVYDTHTFEKLAEIEATSPSWHLFHRSRAQNGAMRMDFVTDPVDRRLLDDWQRDFPIAPRPFAEIGARLGVDESEVVNRLTRMQLAGRITRVGGTCTPNTVSASTLAAVAAPSERIEDVAAIIGAEPGVNHSYLREHDLNLWFVATGPDRAHVNQTLTRIGMRSGLDVLDLRLVRAFNVDLGFRMTEHRSKPPAPRPVDATAMRSDDGPILQALTSGLPLCPRPFAAIATELSRSEAEVLDRVQALCDAAVISRLGVIVRHRALGWRANAMVVWDLPHEAIDAAGPRLAAHPGVTLCYERTTVDGVWPYRLYSMIHAVHAARHLTFSRRPPTCRN